MAAVAGLGFHAGLRLREPGEFKAVFSCRRVLRGACFDLHYRPGNLGNARLGLVVAKKLARRAVWRNAIKRVGREAFRLARPGLPELDLVLRLSKRVIAAGADERRAWRQDIDSLLARLPRAAPGADAGHGA